MVTLFEQHTRMFWKVEPELLVEFPRTRSSPMISSFLQWIMFSIEKFSHNILKERAAFFGLKLVIAFGMILKGNFSTFSFFD